MQDKVNLLLNIVSPYRLCKDLGFAVTFNSKSSSIAHPLCNEDRLFLTSNEFISHEFNKNWFRGNIVDFLTILNGTSYRKTISNLFEDYIENAEDPFLKSLIWAKLTLADHMEHTQKLIKGIRELGLLTETDPKLAGVRDFLRSLSLPVRHACKLVAGAQGHQITDLLDKCSCLTIKPHSIGGTKKPALNNKDTYLLLPYYANQHTIVGLGIRHLTEGTEYVVKLHTGYTKAYFGLQTISPADEHNTLYKDELDVLSNYEKHLSHVPEASGCVCIKHLGAGTYVPDKLVRTLLPKTSGTTLPYIVDSLSVAEDLRMEAADHIYTKSYSSMPVARTFLINNFLDVLSEERSVTKTVADYMVELRKDEPLRRMICAQLKSMGRMDVVAQTALSNPEEDKVIVIKGNQVRYTPDGYIVISKDGHSTSLTNFGIKLDTTILFKTTNDIYYRGRVFISDKEYPVMLSKKEAQQPKMLVSALTAAVAADIVDTTDDTRIPTILDSTCSNYLTTIVAHEIHSTNVEVGLDRLGWDDLNTTFQATNWRLASGILQYDQHTPYPGNTHLKCFSFDLMEAVKQVEISDRAKFLFGIVSGICLGAFHGYKIPPIFVKNKHTHKEILLAALTSFGQARVLELNNNFRANTRYLSFVRGYPILCSAPNSKVLDCLNKPLLVIQEEGFDFTDIEDSVETLEAYSNWFFPKLLTHLRSSNQDDCTDVVKAGLNCMTAMGLDVPPYDPGENIIEFRQEGADNVSTGSTATSMPSM
jgi:hypothetical protein